MRESIDTALARAARHLKLDTLVRLRWFVLAGQASTVALVYWGLGFDLPITACLTVIALSVGLNLWLRLNFPRNHRLGDRAAMALLGYNIVQLAVLLFLTGGLQNPFTLLILAPVIISATALPPRYTFALVALAAVLATGLAMFSLPLPSADGKGLELPDYYTFGTWIGILIGLAFSSVYTWRVADEARELARALAATEIVLVREQHLSQLDGLAAAAAHELGTPLSTIALVTKELGRSYPPGTPAGDDIALVQGQIERCRQILGALSTREDDVDAPFLTLGLHELVEEIAAPHRPLTVPVTVAMRGDAPEPVCRRNPGVLYGLANLADNAADFAVSSLVIEASWDENFVSIAFLDDGPGFPADVLLRAGDPYLSRRIGAHSGTLGTGLGLGLFIAKTLLERHGATLRITNRQHPQRGAIVRVTWPRALFERDDTRPKSLRRDPKAAFGVDNA
jgi:two-component system, sensor histidine kinase RegB